MLLLVSSSLLLLLPLSALASQLRAGPGGAYAGVTVNIEEQQQPEDCAAFLDQLEVGYSRCHENTDVTEFFIEKMKELSRLLCDRASTQKILLLPMEKMYAEINGEFREE